VLTSLSGATVRDGAKERQYVTPAIARSGETGRYRGEGGGRRGGGRKEGVPAGSRVRARPLLCTVKAGIYCPHPTVIRP
jgi:hypothetical protein